MRRSPNLVFDDLPGGAEPLLFDDDADPYQLRPLPVGEHPALVEGLLAELAGHCERMDDPWRPGTRELRRTG